MEQFEVLIVGQYLPEHFTDLSGEALIHLQSVEDRNPSDCLPRIDAAVAGWFPPEWLDLAPRLKYFLVPFAGLTPQLRETLSARPDLTVVNTHVTSEFVAEHVFACLFQLNRNMTELDQFMRRPAPLRRSPPPARFITLRGKTVAIVGQGHVGRAVESRARAFGMEVRFYTHDDFRADLKDEKVRLRSLLADSDVVVLTVPLTPETTGLIDEAEFGAMRRDALLVNVSRGEVVKEKALYRALKLGVIRGAAVDTWYNYRDGFFCWDRPFTRNFGKFKNILMTPHVGYRSDELERTRVEEIKSFIRTVRRGEVPANKINLHSGY